MEQKDFLRDMGSIAVVTRLKRISDAMIHDGRRMYKELGMDIEPNWFVIFKLLEKHGPLTVTEIADNIGFAHPSVISIVNKMVKAGYINEKKSASDNRKRILTLTVKSRSKMSEFEEIWDAGKAGFKKMMHDTDVLSMLNTLEARINEKGFRRRSLDQLEKMRAVEIIEFKKKYADDFARLNYEWIAKYYEIEKHDHDQLDHPFQYIIKPGGQIFFAVAEGVVAGTVALIRADEGTFELAKMAVSPAFQGYRIGEKLMQACVEYAEQNETKSIWLESNTKQFAAINLYRKFGFVETPLDPNSLFKRANIRMELAIEQPDR
jgi:ribosomal protein S18 acetylase RimI-like enzyme/DNA-binding MarR family transcriptional regulator